MKQWIALVGFAFLLLAPTYATAQSPTRIIIDDDLGDFERNDHVGIHGKAVSQTNAFVVIQVVNPRGELCNIQQLEPLTSGAFVSSSIALSGYLCGVDGNYDVKIFYGDHRATSSFTVLPTELPSLNDEDTFNNAKAILDERIAQTTAIDATPFALRASSITYPVGTITNSSRVYADLFEASFSDNLFDGLDVNFRRATSDALDEIGRLNDAQTISDTTALALRKQVYTTTYYNEIGDNKKATDQLRETYDAIRTADPSSEIPNQPVTFASLKTTLVSLIQRNNTALSDELRDELAVILARGTGPAYSTELRAMLDILTQARYVEITSKKTETLYTFVAVSWANIHPSLKSASTIDEFVESGSRLAGVYDAAFLLRDLDKVERFIDSEDTQGLAGLLRPEWNSLNLALRAATNVEDILAQRDAIQRMKAVSEISSRLELAITSTRVNRVSTDLTDQWPGLLERVSTASSISEIHTIISEFDDAITALREARNPIDLLKLEYEELRAKAEKLADRTALANIENAQSILRLAEKLSTDNASQTKLDRIEVLLAWVIQTADEISDKITNLTPEDNRRLQTGILERAQSLENLAELGLRTQRFVPGYMDYVDDVKATVERARALVIAGELQQADDLIRRATADWREVSEVYRDAPPTSGDYGRVDIERRDYTKHADDLASIATRFIEAGTDEAREFSQLINMVEGFVDHGNFVDAHSAITRAYEYAQEHLRIEHNSVIYDINYNPETRSWLIEGFVEKQPFDRREDISVIVRTADGSVHQSLDFADTSHGRFHVPFEAPSDPGIYVAELLWRNTSTSNIVYIPYPTPTQQDSEDTTEYSGGVELIEISRDLYDLQEFMRGFGGQQYQANIGRITPLVDSAQEAVNDRNVSEARSDMFDIRNAIERYLPLRSPEVVVRATYTTDGLTVDGAVHKLVEFPEDIYVDIFDQRGDLEVTLNLNDGPDGKFSEDVRRSFESGTYVVMLSYHDLRVSDFFTVP